MRHITNIVLVIAIWLVLGCQPGYSQCGTTYSTRQTTYYTPSYSYATPSYNYTPSYTPPVYHAPTYEAKKEYVAFTRLVAFFPVLDVPTYGVSVYAPPGTVPITPQTQATVNNANAISAAGGDIGKILEAIKIMNKAVELIDARLGRLEGGNPNPPQQQRQPNQPQTQQAPQPAGSAQQIVTNKCAICHNPKEVGEWGGGFSMVNGEGKLEKLSASAFKKLTKHVMANTMPPSEKDRTGDLADKLKTFKGKMPDKLTNEEAGVLVSYYSGATKETSQERLEISEVRPQPRVLIRK